MAKRDQPLALLVAQHALLGDSELGADSFRLARGRQPVEEGDPIIVAILRRYAAESFEGALGEAPTARRADVFGTAVVQQETFGTALIKRARDRVNPPVLAADAPVAARAVLQFEEELEERARAEGMDALGQAGQAFARERGLDWHKAVPGRTRPKFGNWLGLCYRGAAQWKVRFCR
jgi:hypothetical protein